MKVNEKIGGRIKAAVCIGFAAAVMLSTADGTEISAKNQSFLFPQFAGAAASDKKHADKSMNDKDDKDYEIVYSFRFAEILEKWFL